MGDLSGDLGAAFSGEPGGTSSFPSSIDSVRTKIAFKNY